MGMTKALTSPWESDVIYAGAGIVVDERHHISNPAAPECWECGSLLKDMGYWKPSTGWNRIWRCHNKECFQCAIDKQPVKVPSYSEGFFL